MAQHSFRQWSVIILTLVLGSLIIGRQGISADVDSAEVVVQGWRSDQVWEGFGASAVLIDMFDSSSQFGEPAGTIAKDKRPEILRAYYEDLGMSRARFFPQGYEPANDNDDPMTINPQGFLWKSRGTRETRSVDTYCDEHLLMGKPFRPVHEPFVFFPALNVWETWLHMETARGKQRHRFNPEMVDEYAEHALAAVLHIRDEYGYELPAWSLFNEPIHGAKPSKDTLLQLVLAVGRRFSDAGVKTELTICDDAWPEASAEAIEQVLAHQEARTYVGSVSYHRYRISLAERAWAMLENVHLGKPIIPAPVSFYDSAKQHGKSVWLTEIVNYGGWGLTADDAGRARANHIVDEINNGKVNAFDFMLTWGPPKSGRRGSGGDSRLVHLLFEDGRFARAKVADWAQWIWHFSRHIRPGDVRLATDSTDPRVKTVAFRHDRGHSLKLVVINNNPHRVSLKIRLRDLSIDPHAGVIAVGSTYGKYRQACTVQEPTRTVWQSALPPMSITTYSASLGFDSAPLIESLVIDDPEDAVSGQDVRLVAQIWDPQSKVARAYWLLTESRSGGQPMVRHEKADGVVQWIATFPLRGSNWPGTRHAEIYLQDKDGKVLRSAPNGPLLRAVVELPTTLDGRRPSR